MFCPGWVCSGLLKGPRIEGVATSPIMRKEKTPPPPNHPEGSNSPGLLPPLTVLIVTSFLCLCVHFPPWRVTGTGSVLPTSSHRKAPQEMAFKLGQSRAKFRVRARSQLGAEEGWVCRPRLPVPRRRLVNPPRHGETAAKKRRPPPSGFISFRYPTRFLGSVNLRV